MGYELARALLLSETITPHALERALFTSLQKGVTLPRALLETNALDPSTLDDMLGRAEGPTVRTVLPMMDLMARLPPGLCERLLAVPIRRDPMSGIVDVAVADARDPHTQHEIEHHLGSPVRLIRASMTAIEEGLTRKTRTMPPAASVRGGQSTKTSAFAPPQAPQPAHPPQSSYASQVAHAPQPNYAPQAAHAPQPNYAPQAAHAPQAHEPQAAHAPQQSIGYAGMSDDDDYGARSRAVHTSQSGQSVQPSHAGSPGSRPPTSRFPINTGIIPAVVPERRQIPAVNLGSQEPRRQDTQSLSRPVTSMTPPWGTAVPSVRAPESRFAHHSMPHPALTSQGPARAAGASGAFGASVPAGAPLFGETSGTKRYNVVPPEPDETRPGPVTHPGAGAVGQSGAGAAARATNAVHGGNSNSLHSGTTQIPPPLGLMSTESERSPAIERPIPLTRMSVNAPRERVQTLYYERHPTQLPHSSYEAEPLPSFIPGPPPRTARGPYNAQAGFPFADGSSVVSALRNAEERDQVLELLLLGARAVARKVAIFVVKRGGLVGWTCSPEFGERAQLQALLMSLTTPSIFTTAMNEGLYLGAIRQDDVHSPLLRVMGGASRDVAVAPVRVLGKAAVVLVADELGDTMIATRRLEELARAAGEAFARIMKNRK